MDSSATGAVFLFALLWGFSALVGWAVGSSKGRGFDGFVLGLFFGPVGIIAIAGMYPSAKFSARRDQEKAEALARVLRTDRALRESTDKVVGVAEVEAGSSPSHADDEAVDEPALTFTVRGCDNVGRDEGPLMFALEPGWLFINACREDCEVTDHELMLNSKQALTLWEKVHSTVTTHSGQALNAGLRDEKVVIDWLDDLESPAGVMIDWTELYGAVPAPESDGDAECGWVFLAGALDDEGSSLVGFLDALYLSAKLADAWDRREVDRSTVERQLADVGSLE